MLYKSVKFYEKKYIGSVQHLHPPILPNVIDGSEETQT